MLSTTYFGDTEVREGGVEVGGQEGDGGHGDASTPWTRSGGREGGKEGGRAWWINIFHETQAVYPRLLPTLLPSLPSLPPEDLERAGTLSRRSRGKRREGSEEEGGREGGRDIRGERRRGVEEGEERRWGRGREEGGERSQT